MWNFLKSLSLFNQRDSDELSSDEEDEIINSLADLEHADYNIKTEEKIGKVTNIEGNIAVIDNVYYFHFNPSLTGIFKLNDKVKFTVLFDNLNNFVKNVEKVDSVASVEEEKSLIPESNLNLLNVCSLSGQIFNRHKRLIEVKLDKEAKVVNVDLNCVKSEFIPSLGDFVELDINLGSSENKTQIDEIEGKNVFRIRPRKTALKMGVVTSWDEKYGSISNFALFTLNVCEPGLSPGVGQKVCASLIRSDCLNGYKWRAIQVIPQEDLIINSSKSKDHRKVLEDEFRNKKGISIPISPKYSLNLHDEIEFKVEVSNMSSVNVLVMAYPDSSFEHSQVSILGLTSKRITIKAGEVLDFPFKITAKFIGKSYEDFIWDFGDFKIRRRITFDVLCDNVISESIPSYEHFDNYFGKRISSRHILSKTEGDIIPGRKKNRNCFMPVKIKEYCLPKQILETILPENGSKLDDTRNLLERYCPCLKLGLKQETYSEYMHTLLFVEEVESLRKLAALDLENASFIKYLDYLILKVPEHSYYIKLLSAGDYVLVTTPWNKDKKMQGIIHKVTKSELWLMFSKHFHSDYREGSCYSTHFISSRTPLRRVHQAIDNAVQGLGIDWLFPNCVSMKAPQVIIEDLEEEILPFGSEELVPELQLSSNDNVTTYLGRGRGKKMFREKRTYWNCGGSGYGNLSRNKEYVSDIDTVKVKKVEWFNCMLNHQQKQAVIRVLFGVARPLPYIIFGPPGTGKTVTIVEAILQVHSVLPKSRVLVGTPTNSAADLISQRLLESGNLQEGDFLRLVGVNYAEQGRLTSSLVPYSAIPCFNSKLEDKDSCDFQSFNRNQIAEHRIIVGTLNCLGNLYCMGFPRGYFTHIFIDEAGQATEPEYLVPMSFLSLSKGHVILCGDPLQLGPVVLSYYATLYRFNDSFLVRILNRFPYLKDTQGFSKNFGYDPRLVTKLVNNYRSLSGILQVFNSLFYDGDLIANVSNETSEEALFLNKLKSFEIHCPVIFHGLRGTCLQDRDSKSLYNPQEVFQVFTYLNRLYFDGVHPDQIGIITPYQLQAEKIREVLESNNLEAPKIGSVEEFQGQERMVIILSIVKSLSEVKDLFDTSFVTDPRRVNVAISRAQSLLIIIGDPETLNSNRIWHKILKYCVVNGSYVGCHLPQNLKSDTCTQIGA